MSPVVVVYFEVGSLMKERVISVYHLSVIDLKGRLFLTLIGVVSLLESRPRPIRFGSARAHFCLLTSVQLVGHCNLS